MSQNPVMELTEQQLRLLAFPPNAEGNAEAVKYLYGDVIRYTNEWQWWDGNEWVNDESKVWLLIEATLRRRQELAAMSHDTVLLNRCSCNARPIMNVMRLLKASF